VLLDNRTRGPVTVRAGDLLPGERILAVARGVETELSASAGEEHGRPGSSLATRAGKAPSAAPPGSGTGSAPAAVAPSPLTSRPSFTPGGPGYVCVTKRAQENFKALTVEAINSRFKNMKLAFRYVDLDGSGRADKDEIMRALTMWNIPHERQHVENMIMEMDADSDGHINYKEFVDHLARDTVAPEATMRTPDSWRNVITADNGIDTEPMGRFRRNMADNETLEKIIKALRRAVYKTYPDLFTAFQKMDYDHSGYIDRKDMERALRTFKVPFDERSVKLLMRRCDTSGDGKVIWAEFEAAMQS